MITTQSIRESISILSTPKGERDGLDEWTDGDLAYAFDFDGVEVGVAEGYTDGGFTGYSVAEEDIDDPMIYSCSDLDEVVEAIREILAGHDSVDIDGTDLIRGAHVRTVEAQLAADVARTRRDDLIRAAISRGQTIYGLAKAVGLTEQALYRIRDRG